MRIGIVLGFLYAVTFLARGKSEFRDSTPLSDSPLEFDPG